MRIRNLFRVRDGTEKRATGKEWTEDPLLSAIIGNTEMTVEKALQIPSVAGCINAIASAIAMLPIKLYQENEGKVTEVKYDPRVKLLNEDSRDALDAFQMKQAFTRDYLLTKGGYIYINKQRNLVQSLHYVDSNYVSINKNADPIFKTVKISVAGTEYEPFDFVKILRNTKDGASGNGIVAEHCEILKVAYNAMILENSLMSTGGGKRGFVKAARKLSDDAMAALKAAWKEMFTSNPTANKVIVLNEGLEFQESANTSVEMQMNEHKKVNADEICKLFCVPPSILSGKATDVEWQSFIKLAVMPVIRAIESAVNRSLLLEKEKEIYYFAGDTKEMLKGEMQKRFMSYTEAVKAGWVSKNEIRYLEDMEPIEGLDVVTISLGEVIYDINTKTYYTPNTKMVQDISSNQNQETKVGE